MLADDTLRSKGIQMENTEIDNFFHFPKADRKPFFLSFSLRN